MCERRNCYIRTKSEKVLFLLLVYYYKGDVVKQQQNLKLIFKKFQFQKKKHLKNSKKTLICTTPVKGVTATQEVKDGIVTNLDCRLHC